MMCPVTRSTGRCRRRLRGNDLGLQFDLSAYTVFGILLIVLMYLMPTGIAGGLFAAYRRLRRG